MRKPAPVHLITHFPHTEEAAAELAHRAAGIHAETVLRQIKELSCPVEQKMELLEAVVQTAAQTLPSDAPLRTV